MSAAAGLRDAARVASAATTELLALADDVERGTITSARDNAAGLKVSLAVHLLEEVEPQIRKALRRSP